MATSCRIQAPVMGFGASGIASGFAREEYTQIKTSDCRIPTHLLNVGILQRIIPDEDQVVLEKKKDSKGKTENNAKAESLQKELEHKSHLIRDLERQVKELKQENGRINQEPKKNIKEDKTRISQVIEENHRLKKELSSKNNEIKNLQLLFSAIGKEKETMSRELTLKANVIADMEEHVNDLKVQNQGLANKVESYARESKARLRDSKGAMASLHNRNKELSDQLLKSSEGSRALSRRMKECIEQNKALKREIANLKISLQKQQPQLMRSISRTKSMEDGREVSVPLLRNISGTKSIEDASKACVTHAKPTKWCTA